MAEEEKEKLPIFALKDVKLGDAVKLTLDCAAPVKTGESKYGTWYLWFVLIDKQKVRDGTKNITGYTGKALFFPSEVLNKDLTKICDGKVGTVVSVTKTAEEGKKGLITRYVVTKLKDGEVPSSSSSKFTPTEQEFLQDLYFFIGEEHKITEQLLLGFIGEPQFDGKITIERAKELLRLVENDVGNGSNSKKD